MDKKRLSRFAIPFAAISMLGAVSGNAYTSSAAVDVNVMFTRALVVIAGDPIQFGNVVINGNAGTVNLDKNTCDVTWSGGYQR